MKKYPLLQSQLGVFMECVKFPESTQYNLPTYTKFDESVDEEKLANAWTEIIKAKAVFRNRYEIDESGNPVQWSDDNMEIVITRRSCSQKELDEYAENGFVRPFDVLSGEPLFRVELVTTENGLYQLVDIHHTIMDGFGYVKLASKELDKFYKGKTEATDLAIYEIAEQEKNLQETEAYISARKYFIDKFSGQEFVTLSNSDGSKLGKMLRVSSFINREQCEAWCKENNIKIDMLFQAAFSHAMGSLTRQQKLVYGTAFHGRTSKDKMKATGMFVNTVSVLADVTGDLTVRKLTENLQTEMEQAFSNGVYPIRHLFTDIHNFPRVVFNFEAIKSMITQYKINGKASEAIELVRGMQQDDICVHIKLYEDKFDIRLESCEAMYDQQTLKMLAEAIKNTIINMMVNPEAKLKEISLIADEKDIQELINLGCGPVLERDHSETIVSIFKNRVAESPNATAVVFKDKSYTYAELDRISDNLAVYLKKNYDIKAEENVGVLINRSELMLIYPLAIMKNGAAYMPLDPHFPTDRLKFMCDDASVKVILSEGSLLEEKLPDFAGARFNSSELNNIPEASAEEISELAFPEAHNRLVIIFTSGSTGKPKAVDLEHYGIANYCHWYVNEFELTMADRVAGYANFGFDAHMIDFYPSILAGSAVYIFDEEMRMDVNGMNAYMEANNISVAFITTQVGCIIREINHSLRYLSTGGEKMPPVTPPDFRFLNVYGPTECSLFSTYYDVKGYFEGEYIGYPLANYQLYVIDQSCNLLPKGAAGELLIAGEGVARGYMNRPELTAEKFIMFKPTENSEPVRAYRSGDLVRWSENDGIQFLGRIDKQVKLRGLRIELGEIENRAASFAGIKQVAVDVKNDQLCCYYVAGAEINKDELKAHLAEKLTEFMVPEVYVQLEVMPLNANGKVDRKALPEPEVALDEIIPPATDLEEKLFALVSEIIKTDKFGVTNNLVSVGLSSLGAMRLSAAISSKMSVQIKVAEIMKSPVIRDLANFISNDGNAQAEAIKHTEDREFYPITENQRGVYIDWEMNRDTTQYNIPAVYKFTDKNPEKLAEAVKSAIDVHSTLKTRFVFVNSDVMQQPHTDEAAEVLLANLENEPAVEFFQNRVKPFDLLNDRLYRAEIYSYGENTYLFLDVHHTLYDGLSTAVLTQDILKAYSGAELKVEEINEYDFAVYESELAGTEIYTKAELYYKNLAEDANAVKYTASQKPDNITNNTVEISVEAKQINDVCARNGITVSSYFNAAFAETLQRISREENPMYLTISNGREADARLVDCVGMFVKTLPVVLRTENHKKETVAEFLNNFHSQLQNSIENDFYPYTKIVEKYGLKGEILFAYQGGVLEGVSIENVETIPLKLDTVKLPVKVTVFPEDNNYKIVVEYNGMRYSQHDMQVLAEAIKNVAVSITTAENVSDIEMVSEEEKAEIISRSCGEYVEYDSSKTWLSMFAMQVKNQPEGLAVADGNSSYTYGELDEISNKVAAYLINNGVAVNDFVAVKMNRAKEYAAAVIGIQKAGAAFVPVDMSYPAERIEYMLADSNAKISLTEEDIKSIAAENTVAEPIDKSKPENRAYMIYTSGSTGKPKGVVLHQRGLMNFTKGIMSIFELTNEDRISSHRSFSFDAHIGDFYPTLSAGASVHIMPDEIRKDLDQIYNFLMEHEITGGGYTTSIAKLLLTNYDLKQRFISCGGEALRDVKSDTVQIFNLYGPTECTNDIVVGKLEKGRYYESAPVGAPMINSYCFIVDSHGKLVPQGVRGEICYAGPQTGYGYWNLDDKTKEVFEDCPFVNGLRMYHTGDVGYYNAEGQIEYVGRIDFQVKLNGFRIELGEIEGKALQFAGVRQVSAQVRKSQICLYYSTDKEVDKDELNEFLSTALASYMVPTVYMPLEVMPLTPNGKVDRKALPDPEITLGEIIAPVNELEEKLLIIAKRFVNTDEFGVTNNLISLGLSSLAAMRLVASINNELDVQIRVADVMKKPVLRDIAEKISTGNNQEIGIKHYEEREYYPLTENQRGIYIDWEMNRETTQYNIPAVYKFNNKDSEKLAEAVKIAFNAHSYLKNSFVQLADDIMQKPNAEAPVEVLVADLKHEPNKEFFQSRIKPFDLLHDKLYRIELYKYNDSVYLFMDIHHTVIDGMSAAVLMIDILAAYNGESVEAEKITAYDVALYEQELLLADDFVKTEEYFNTLAKGAEAVSYPSSLKADGVKNGSVSLTVPAKDINASASKNGITVNSYFQAALSEVLIRLSRLEKPMYLTISNGRSAGNQLDRTTGMFVKTLPVSIVADKEHNSIKTTDFMKFVHEELQKTYELDYYPYTKFVEKHNLHGEIMFAYQGGMGKKSDEFENIDISLDTAKLPILISVFPADDEYIIHAEYDGIRYNKADINTLLNAIANASISMSRAEKIGDIKLINSEEENTLINLGCGPVLERDRSETIISIFKNRVAESPNKVAVVFKDKSYTYAELDRISDNLAVYLKKNYDIKAEENVGVLINRSELMLIYPLAIMKNGAAYMPLDPHFPTDRLSFMCDDASVKVILSEGNLLEEKLPDFAGAGFNSGELNNIPEVSGDEAGILTAPKANDRMVILFTSGSTGVPKAVELEQHSIANFCHWYAKDFELTADDRVSAYANFGFDAHMMDIYPAIFAGATVYILPDEMRKDLQMVNEYMEEVGITVSFFTTQVGCLIKDMNKSLRLMSVGGEKLPLTTAPGYRFVNGYGPTECAIYSATCDVEGTADGTYIGRPLANYQLYIIDQNCQLVPRGAAGELLICGEGVARGYMNRPELTAEKFIIFKPTEDSEPVRAYRSGDLVRWAENDNIQYLGRIDKQVKLRGLRIELGEIENRAASFAGIKQVAVDVKNDQLCCYYVAEAEINKDELKAHLAEKLTEFMVPEVYMQLDVMPLNANGKVDRKALPEPAVELDEIVPPATELEEKLFAVVAEAIKNDNFGVTSNLISLGMSSLAAMKLSVAINAKLGLKIKVAEIMKKPTVRDIAGLFEKPLTENKADSKGLEDVYRLLRSYKKGELPVGDILEQMCQLFPDYAGDLEDIDAGIKHVEEREYYPITENQRGIYIDWEMNRETTQYNVPSVYKFTDKSIHKLAAAIKTAVDNHSYLKTRFVQHGEDIMQQPHMEEAVEILINTDCTNLNEKFFQSRIKPFDLFNDKLYRFELYQEENTVYLFMDIHHIIFDGLSTMIILDDIAKAYAGEKLEAETISAYDVAVYEQDLINSELYSKAEARYDNLLTGANVLSYPDSNKADGAGSVSIEACISAEAMDKFCTKNGFTANSYLQTVFAHVMHLFTRVENPVYLTISNGRSASLEVNKAVGMFVKTIPVVLKTENVNLSDIKVTDFVASMQEQLQESYEMEFYPYTSVVQRHKLHAEMMFVCQSGMEANANIDNIKLSLDTVKLPIEVVVYPYDKGYKIHIDYDGKRYNHKEMQNFVNTFVNVAETMPLAEKVKEITLLDTDTFEAVKKLSMGKNLPYDNTETWLDMLQSFTEENPAEIALVDSAGSYTYGELEALSNKLATYLVESGVKENDFVAIKMGRVKEFMAAVVGIQKAGAAYVPVDPDYPAERVEYMLSNSEAKFVLDETSLAEILAKDFETKLINKAKPENLAYMIYTSGSTGKPKGVMQSQRSLRAFVNWRVKELNITSKSRHAQHASFSFDASLDDLISPLAVGAQVHIFDDVIRKDMEGMCKYIKDNGITGITMPTQLGMTLLNQYPDMPLQFFMMGGEKMLPFAKTDITVINGYGPTEFTVCSSFHKVNQEIDTDIPIGRPVPNTYSFICDRMGNLLPQGMTGELCLCGPQLSNGYWKLPEKTAEVFVDCPFLSGQKMYRTGDLARYNENGELEYLGRIDFQVKLRGFRIELGEIENRAAAFTGIKQVSAQVKKDQLVLYYTAEIDINKNILKEFMAETLTEYMVPSVYMQLEKMPMTPVGKIDRKALPEPRIERSTEYVEPVNDIERAIAESMQQLLGLEEKVGAMDSFLELGGDSIKAIRMISLLRQKNINLQVANVMKLKTVRKMAEAVSNSAVVINQEPWSGTLYSSAIAEYFFDLDLKKASQFNQANILKCRERADIAKLQQAFNALTYQHDAFRMVVDYNEKQFIVKPADTIIKIEEYEANSSDEILEICNSIQTGLDLHEVLARTALIHSAECDYFLIVMHHIIVDGVSWRIIIPDLEMAYSQLMNGAETVTLPEKTHTYNDYVNALRAYRDSYKLSLEIPYWKKMQEKMFKLPVSCINDHDREFSIINAVMNTDETKAFVKANGDYLNVDINDLLLTATARAFSKISNQDSVAVMLEGHGREDIGSNLVIDRTVGWFTSVYPVVFTDLKNSLENTLLSVKDELHRIPNKGVGYNILIEIEGEQETGLEKYDRVGQISFNYLGEFSNVTADNGNFFDVNAGIDSGDSVAKENVFGSDLGINCAINEGQFNIRLDYNKALYTKEKAELFTEGILQEIRELTALLSNNNQLIITATDLGEVEWSRAEFNSVVNEFAQRGEVLKRIYPLTPMQEGMLFKHLSEPESWAYRLVSIFEMGVLPTEAQLRNALDKLAFKHEVLRTAIIHDGVQISRQAIVANRKLGLEMRDITSEQDQRKAVCAIREELLNDGYDLQRKPLMNVICAKRSDDSCYLVMALHHIIIDGWCNTIYLPDFFNFIYEEMQNNKL